MPLSSDNHWVCNWNCKANNFLEQLIAEWYELQGYFLRRNVWVGKRAKGGYECELDIIAFHPGKKHLVQIEPSMDASSWAERERKYKSPRVIPILIEDAKIPLYFDDRQYVDFRNCHNNSIEKIVAIIETKLEYKSESIRLKEQD